MIPRPWLSKNCFGCNENAKSRERAKGSIHVSFGLSDIHINISVVYQLCSPPPKSSGFASIFDSCVEDVEISLNVEVKRMFLSPIEYDTLSQSIELHHVVED